MNVCIYGEYTKGSLGDHLILLGLLEAIFTSDQNVRVSIICSDNSSVYDTIDLAEERFGIAHEKMTITPIIRNKLLSRVWTIVASLRNNKRCYRTMHFYRWHRFRAVDRLLRKKNVCALLLGGGQMLMDLYPQGVMEPLEIIRRFRSRGTDLLSFGIGAGPLKTKAARDDVSEILGSLRFVGTRDAESKKLLKSIRDDVEIGNMGDAGFLLYDVSKKRFQGADHTRRLTIGVSIVPFHMPGYWPQHSVGMLKNWMASWQRLLVELHAEIGNVEFHGITTNIPYDTLVMKSVFKALPSGIPFHIPEQRSLRQVLDATANAGLIVGSRMHACVAGMVQGKLSLGVAYQPKVSSLFGECGIPEYCIGVESDGGFNHNRILEGTLELINDQSMRDSYFLKIQEYAGGIKEAFFRVMQK